MQYTEKVVAGQGSTDSRKVSKARNQNSEYLGIILEDKDRLVMTELNWLEKEVRKVLN